MFADLPGVCSNGFSLDAVSELTGMKVKYNAEQELPHCIFNIVSGAKEEVYSNQTGVQIAINDKTWLMLNADISAKMLIDLMKRCGVKMIIDSEGVVHGNSKLLGVFSTVEKGIKGQVNLPKKDDWYEWFTKTEYANTDKITIDIEPRKARLFISKSLMKNC